ncbi:MAG: amidohydrolase family protein, partial [Rhizobiaceae bacterium]
MKNSIFLAGVVASFVLAFAPQSGMAQDDEALPQTLFINVNVFDGTSDTLAMNQRVLVEGNLIKTIGDE